MAIDIAELTEASSRLAGKDQKKIEQPPDWEQAMRMENYRGGDSNPRPADYETAASSKQV